MKLITLSRRCGLALLACVALLGGCASQNIEQYAAERPALDRWVLSEAHRLAREVDAALEAARAGHRDWGRRSATARAELQEERMPDRS